jgi:hypothetical protein
VAAARSHLALHTRSDGAADGRPVNVVFLPETLALLRECDPSLRTVFGWYASLDASDPRLTTWEAVRASGGTVGRTETMLLLLNFRVVPALISRNDALDAFSRHAREAHPAVNTHRKGDPLAYPAFLEAIANIAIAVADGMEERMRASVSSPDDMRTLLRYATGVPGELGERLREVAAAQSAAWSASLAATMQPFGDLPHGVARDDALATTAARTEAAAAAEEARQAVLSVAARREALMKQHAVVRKSNSRRDVRTPVNNPVWPLNHATGTLHESLPRLTRADTAGQLQCWASAGSLTECTDRVPHYREKSAQQPHLNTKVPARVAFFSDPAQIKF